MEVTVAGLCTCGAIIAASPAVGVVDAAPRMPGHHLWYAPKAAGDSEPFHPAEPEQTFDGPAAIYSATVATSRPASLPRYGGGAGSRRYNGGAGSRRYNGGAVPTS